MGANHSSNEVDIMQGQTTPSQQLNSASNYLKEAANKVYTKLYKVAPFSRNTQVEANLSTQETLQHKVRELQTYRFPPNEVLSEYKFPSSY